MVGVDSGSLYRRTHILSRLAWSWVGGRLAPFYIILSNEPGALSQWLCHDDSNINIVLDIIIFIIIIMLTRAWAILLKECRTNDRMTQRTITRLRQTQSWRSNYRLL